MDWRQWRQRRTSTGGRRLLSDGYRTQRERCVEHAIVPVWVEAAMIRRKWRILHRSVAPASSRADSAQVCRLRARICRLSTASRIHSDSHAA